MSTRCLPSHSPAPCDSQHHAQQSGSQPQSPLGAGSTPGGHTKMSSPTGRCGEEGGVGWAGQGPPPMAPPKSALLLIPPSSFPYLDCQRPEPRHGFYTALFSEPLGGWSAPVQLRPLGEQRSSRAGREQSLLPGSRLSPFQQTHAELLLMGAVWASWGRCSVNKTPLCLLQLGHGKYAASLVHRPEHKPVTGESNGPPLASTKGRVREAANVHAYGVKRAKWLL